MTKVKIIRAEKLISGLGGEKERWTNVSQSDVISAGQYLTCVIVAAMCSASVTIEFSKQTMCFYFCNKIMQTDPDPGMVLMVIAETTKCAKRQITTSQLTARIWPKDK